MSTVERAFKYRFYPTQEQESLLRRTQALCPFGL
ncbi:MAG: helix-turn-helix domain-containing protein [Nostoc sp.]